MHSVFTEFAINSKATRQDVERAAHKLLCCPGVEGVELFGSIARQGYGNDVDLILIVSDDLAQEFIFHVHRLLETKRYRHDQGKGFYGARALRRVAAAATLGRKKFNNIYAHASKWTTPHLIEVFLFPADWRKQLHELQAIYPHRDPEFMKKIAKDAVVLLDGKDRHPSGCVCEVCGGLG
ncbi:MAG: hypothetical protein A2942_04725 [Candidatus Lloydbacteria bacterium RIFCSPLOWO2_01_FULL_50_20]|uniref:Uncharacterized protein n=1 Tax=Candidatus Lloydbacteria bacterium RIFCSPLOWO2_01_FULL_50_20 TaxID=1798665 RepID=A0A1G2DL27_9BACT|nr:MAG: hypothetical protein A3C13_03585 [Candidatus Lloydbacteria bacterium RIFCSPHIGHO2_02_FULL_50_11]OGZ13620.1 MAG: hypothetical protein A2942_04725 [Candidatus Lloydbacteria bacterium RIFCSPLOWO2_01_FULL_50_20]